MWGVEVNFPVTQWSLLRSQTEWVWLSTAQSLKHEQEEGSRASGCPLTLSLERLLLAGLGPEHSKGWAVKCQGWSGTHWCTSRLALGFFRQKPESPSSWFLHSYLHSYLIFWTFSISERTASIDSFRRHSRAYSWKVSFPSHTCSPQVPTVATVISFQCCAPLAPRENCYAWQRRRRDARSWQISWR